MSPASAREFYDQQYQLHDEGKRECGVSVHDLAKARRRVGNALHTFRIDLTSTSRVLDVGSGLGYYSAALAESGAAVTGIDISPRAVEVARKMFPACRFRCASWPEALSSDETYDLVWAIDLSVINTLELEQVRLRYIEPALSHLTDSGSVLLGWSTRFTGRNEDNWAHWSLSQLADIQRSCGLGGLRTSEARGRLTSIILIAAAWLLRRSIPIMLHRTRSRSHPAPTLR